MSHDGHDEEEVEYVLLSDIRDEVDRLHVFLNNSLDQLADPELSDERAWEMEQFIERTAIALIEKISYMVVQEGDEGDEDAS